MEVDVFGYTRKCKAIMWKFTPIILLFFCQLISARSGEVILSAKAGDECDMRKDVLLVEDASSDSAYLQCRPAGRGVVGFWQWMPCSKGERFYFSEQKCTTASLNHATSVHNKNGSGKTGKNANVASTRIPNQNNIGLAPPASSDRTYAPTTAATVTVTTYATTYAHITARGAYINQSCSNGEQCLSGAICEPMSKICKCPAGMTTVFGSSVCEPDISTYAKSTIAFDNRKSDGKMVSPGSSCRANDDRCGGGSFCSPDNGVCTCPEGFADKEGVCTMVKIEPVPPGEKCNAFAYCTGGATCSLGVCKCESPLVQNGAQCILQTSPVPVKKHSGPGEPCDQGQICTGGSLCSTVTLLCSCPIGTRDNGEKCAEVSEMPANLAGVGQKCNMNTDCVVGAFCSASANPPSCQCLSTHVDVGKSCYRIVFPGQRGCDLNEQCAAAFDGAACVNNACMCPPGMTAKGQTCRADSLTAVSLSPGQPCTKNGTVVCVGGSICLRGVCTCPRGRIVSGNACVRRQNNMRNVSSANQQTFTTIRTMATTVNPVQAELTDPSASVFTTDASTVDTNEFINSNSINMDKRRLKISSKTTTEKITWEDSFLGSSCQENASCIIPNSICLYGSCQCDFGYMPISNRTCVTKNPAIGEKCRRGQLCANGAKCKRGVCHCPNGTVPNGYYCDKSTHWSSQEATSAPRIQAASDCTDGSVWKNGRCEQSPGGSCAHRQTCVNASICLANVCRCHNGKEPFENTCNTAMYDQSCVHGEHCILGTVCSKDTKLCVCPNGASFDWSQRHCKSGGPTMVRTTPIPPTPAVSFSEIGAPCDSNLICPGESVCSNGVCVCPFGLSEVGKDSCLRRFVQPGQQCSSAEHLCATGSSCVNGVCQCLPGTTLLQDECVRTGASGPSIPCSADDPPCAGSSVCVEGTCVCPEGKRAENGTCASYTRPGPGHVCDHSADSPCSGGSMCSYVTDTCECPDHFVIVNAVCVAESVSVGLFCVSPPQKCTGGSVCLDNICVRLATLPSTTVTGPPTTKRHVLHYFQSTPTSLAHKAVLCANNEIMHKQKCIARQRPINHSCIAAVQSCANGAICLNGICQCPPDNTESSFAHANGSCIELHNSLPVGRSCRPGLDSCINAAYCNSDGVCTCSYGWVDIDSGARCVPLMLRPGDDCPNANVQTCTGGSVCDPESRRCMCPVGYIPTSDYCIPSTFAAYFNGASTTAPVRKRPPGASCVEINQCLLSGAFCREGRCVCPPGANVVGDECQMPVGLNKVHAGGYCKKDGHCMPGMKCLFGVCTCMSASECAASVMTSPPGGSCAASQECVGSSICKNGWCVCPDADMIVYNGVCAYGSVKTVASPPVNYITTRIPQQNVFATSPRPTIYSNVYPLQTAAPIGPKAIDPIFPVLPGVDQEYGGFYLQPTLGPPFAPMAPVLGSAGRPISPVDMSGNFFLPNNGGYPPVFIPEPTNAPIFPVNELMPVPGMAPFATGDNRPASPDGFQAVPVLPGLLPGGIRSNSLHAAPTSSYLKSATSNYVSKPPKVPVPSPLASAGSSDNQLAPPGSPCDDRVQCIGGSICQRGECVCKDGYEIIGELCVQQAGSFASAAPLESCTRGELCSGGSFCDGHICQCPGGTEVRQSYCQATVPKLAAPNAPCGSGEQCIGDSKCNKASGRCECPKSTIAVGERCLPLGRLVTTPAMAGPPIVAHTPPEAPSPNGQQLPGQQVPGASGLLNQQQQQQQSQVTRPYSPVVQQWNQVNGNGNNENVAPAANRVPSAPFIPFVTPSPSVRLVHFGGLSGPEGRCDNGQVCTGGSSCVHNICKCPDRSVPNSNGVCQAAIPNTAATVGDICVEGTVCTGHSVCISGRCRCPHYMMQKGSTCVPLAGSLKPWSVPLRGPCTAADACMGRAICKDGVCVCPQSHTEFNGTCQPASARSFPKAGEPCYDGELCLGSSQCLNGRCQCFPGSTIKNGECIPAVDPQIFSAPGDPCVNIEDCTGGSYCRLGFCVCPLGTESVNLQCVTITNAGFAMAGQSCAKGERCTGRSNCINGFCQCPSDMLNENGVCQNPGPNAIGRSNAMLQPQQPIVPLPNVVPPPELVMPPIPAAPSTMSQPGVLPGVNPFTQTALSPDAAIPLSAILPNLPPNNYSIPLGNLVHQGGNRFTLPLSSILSAQNGGGGPVLDLSSVVDQLRHQNGNTPNNHQVLINTDNLISQQQALIQQQKNFFITPPPMPAQPFPQNGAYNMMGPIIVGQSENSMQPQIKNKNVDSMIAPGQRCEMGQICSGGSVCSMGVCSCPAGLKVSPEGQCVPDGRYVPPGSFCSVGQVCIGGSYCITGVCLCPPGQDIIGYECRPLAVYSTFKRLNDTVTFRNNFARPGMKCTLKKSCLGGSVCSYGICVCPPGTRLVVMSGGENNDLSQCFTASIGSLIKRRHRMAWKERAGTESEVDVKIPTTKAAPPHFAKPGEPCQKGIRCLGGTVCAHDGHCRCPPPSRLENDACKLPEHHARPVNKTAASAAVTRRAKPCPDNSSLCSLPSCYCSRTGKDIPGGLQPEETPQFVIFTFDDAVNEKTTGAYRRLLFDSQRYKNRNGCPIRGTFFVSHEWTSYYDVQQLYLDGHEMASNSITHQNLHRASLEKWVAEMHGQRRLMGKLANVDMVDVIGFRAPQLVIDSDTTFEMMQQADFVYDNSMSANPGVDQAPYWPQTLDYSIPWECQNSHCPWRTFPGLWSVPLNQFFGSSSSENKPINSEAYKRGSMIRATLNSEGETEESIYRLLRRNFDRAYQSNKAPYILTLDGDLLAWAPDNGTEKALERFMDYLSKKSDVWFVTLNQLIDWMRSPQPLSSLNSFDAFFCGNDNRKAALCERPRRCVYKTDRLTEKRHILKTCSECPQNYPWIDNMNEP